MLELQAEDTAIDRLEARRAVAETGAVLSEARAKAETADADVGELGLSLSELDRDQARFEHEIDTLNQKAADEEKRLYDGSVANAKELGSIQHEVENLKRRRADREDELLGLMERREELDTRMTELRRTSSELRAAAEEAERTESSGLAEILEELAHLREQRAAIAATIDPELLELYDDIRPQKKGVAAAALVDGVCQGCHEQLSSVEQDRLKRTEGVRRCERCRRILVF